MKKHEVEEHPPLLSLWAVLQHGVEQLGGLASPWLPQLEELLQLLEVGEGVHLQQTLLEGGVGCVLWQVLDDVHDLGKDLLRESSKQMITLLLLGVHMLESELALSVDEPGFRSSFPECRQLDVPSVLLWLLFIRHFCSGEVTNC
jgi:hypothetical protein